MGLLPVCLKMFYWASFHVTILPSCDCLMVWPCLDYF